MDALKLLRKDHSSVKSLFSKFDRTNKSAYEEQNEIFVEVRRQLQLHSRAEEEIFYPAMKAVNDTGRRLIMDAIEQHREIDELLTQISRVKTSDKKFLEKFETLIEVVDHHIEEEEGEIFQFAEENCSSEQLEDLGGEIEARKRALDQQLAA